MNQEAFQRRTVQAIKDLHLTNKQHLNHQLACEALLHSLLQLVDLRALAALAEEYDQAVDRLATQLPPDLQMRQVWSEFADAIAARRTQLQAQQDRTPGAS